jgi:hypothetical protein
MIYRYRRGVGDTPSSFWLFIIIVFQSIGDLTFCDRRNVDFYYVAASSTLLRKYTSPFENEAQTMVVNDSLYSRFLSFGRFPILSESSVNYILFVPNETEFLLIFVFASCLPR